jgi:isoquinoline 1-oxidoreductase
MAAHAGLDPVEFRRRNLTDARMVRLLDAAAEKFGWTAAKSPSGRGYGVCLTNYRNTYVAGMAEVEVDRATGEVRVRRMVCAQDMGEVVNPAGARAQMLGGVTMGLGYSLAEEIEFDGGRIHTTNFDVYDIPRFSWTPEIETVLIENNDLPPQGGGEPAITITGGVITNAVHDAIGVKLNRLPLTPERIMAALSA